MNNIDSLWDFLDDRSFAYEGKTHTTGVWYYDITKAMTQLKAPWIPKFNSGMFLFKKDEDSRKIFDTAYAMMTGENNMGIGYFRKNMLPDEPYFAASFALNNVWPIERSNEYGRSSHTLINAKKIRINVVKGISSFIKDETFIFPLIVHFCGRLGNIYYAREKIRLLFYTR
jgi:hypothetical protein